jgi:hypothetical protein
VRGAVVTASTRSKSTGSWASTSGHLRVTKASAGLAVALPELDTAATSVVVGRARAETLLLAVITAKEELDNGGDGEEETRVKRSANCSMIAGMDLLTLQ